MDLARARPFLSPCDTRGIDLRIRAIDSIEHRRHARRRSRHNAGFSFPARRKTAAPTIHFS